MQNQDISVVVQGPVIRTGGAGNPAGGTVSTLQSVRHHLPGARLILSTWKDADLKGLDFDELVQPEDPGGVLEKQGIRYNMNRQIVGVMAGLQRVTTRYAAKLRTDCELTGSGFIACHGRHGRRNSEYRVFRERLVCSDLYFRTPDKEPHALLFHPSDIFQYGLTEDLKTLWEIRLAQPGEVLFESASDLPRDYRDLWRKPLFRFVEEQYAWVRCLEKCGFPIPLRCSWEFSPTLMRASELSIINNFVPVAPDELGLRLPARLHSNSAWAIYTYRDFINLEAMYCDPEADPKGITHRQRRFARIAVAKRLRNLALRTKHKLMAAAAGRSS